VLPCARRRRQIHKVLTAKSKANALKVKSGHFDPKDLASYERRNGVKVPAPAVLLFELVLRCQQLHEPSAASVASAQRRICLSRTCLWSAAPLPARWRSRVHAHTYAHETPGAGHGGHYVGCGRLPQQRPKRRGRPLDRSPPSSASPSASLAKSLARAVPALLACLARARQPARRRDEERLPNQARLCAPPQAWPARASLNVRSAPCARCRRHRVRGACVRDQGQPQCA